MKIKEVYNSFNNPLDGGLFIGNAILGTGIVLTFGLPVFSCIALVSLATGITFNKVKGIE